MLAGRIEQLPAALHGQFDAVFSIATFEHIDRMPLALDAMHAALRPGGRLFALFAPIWSAHDGHHLHDVTDQRGRRFNKKRSPIPPWGHLLLTPPELHAHLLTRTDPAAAAEIVYEVYQAPSINRLFAEDYLRYFQASPFQVDEVAGMFPSGDPGGASSRSSSRSIRATATSATTACSRSSRDPPCRSRRVPGVMAVPQSAGRPSPRRGGTACTRRSAASGDGGRLSAPPAPASARRAGRRARRGGSGPGSRPARADGRRAPMSPCIASVSTTSQA